MKTATFLLLLGLSCSFALRSEASGAERIGNVHRKGCRASAACRAYGGYCIASNQAAHCSGLLFPMECTSTHCSCCINATLRRNECTQTKGLCPANSVCQDRDVGYECVCNAGYQLCGDIDECASNPCGANSICQNTIGNYNCVCNTGYVFYNGSCIIPPRK
ncbi:low-density lipoprotein receptor-like [Macrobrachium rosenbergii]|uniref:low-density lipoprotein receptor-like n=1 Tax=Macrobrachium rosenbergii TaxID=79674 RepID=UPI0034D43367